MFLNLQDHKPESVQKTASCIAEEAHKLSFDENYLSPFALSAIDMGIDFIGNLHLTYFSYFKCPGT